MSINALQDAIHQLPPIRDVIADYNLKADKRLGQNFLHDTNITDKIVRHSGNITQHTVLEIGPGTGILTRSILYYGAKHVVAIEKDPRCIPIIESLQTLTAASLELLHDDALTFDEAFFRHHAPLKVIANLPYNIGTELLFNWLEHIEYFDSFTIMLQKEVAQRITAEVGTKHYGYLAILTQLLCDAKIVMTLPPEAFIPAPKVESSVVHIQKRQTPLFEVDSKALKSVAHALFSQRRKMIRASLKQLTESPNELCEELEISPTFRPENLTIEQICALTNALN